MLGNDAPLDLEVVLSTTSVVTAEIARMKLENAGLPCLLDGRTQSGYAGILPIRLLTPKRHAEDARRILEQDADEPIDEDFVEDSGTEDLGGSKI